MTTVWTPEMAATLDHYLETRYLSAGIGTEASACSIAAINLAMSGTVTDSIPDCMSLVIGRWIIAVQDGIPHEMRNSTGWKAALRHVPDTGQDPDKEYARLALLTDWVWDTVLPYLQPAADLHGYGREWERMCTERTGKAARAAQTASSETGYSAGSVASAVEAMTAMYFGRSLVAESAGHVALKASTCPASADSWKSAWVAFDPPGLLARLVAV